MYIPTLCAVGIKPGMIPHTRSFVFVDVRHLILALVHGGKLELRQLQFQEQHHSQLEEH